MKPMINTKVKFVQGVDVGYRNAGNAIINLEENEADLDLFDGTPNPLEPDLKIYEIRGAAIRFGEQLVMIEKSDELAVGIEYQFHHSRQGGNRGGNDHKKYLCAIFEDNLRTWCDAHKIWNILVQPKHVKAFRPDLFPTEGVYSENKENGMRTFWGRDVNGKEFCLLTPKERKRVEEIMKRQNSRLADARRQMKEMRSSVTVARRLFDHEWNAFKRNEWDNASRTKRKELRQRYDAFMEQERKLKKDEKFVKGNARNYKQSWADIADALLIAIVVAWSVSGRDLLKEREERYAPGLVRDTRFWWDNGKMQEKPASTSGESTGKKRKASPGVPRWKQDWMAKKTAAGAKSVPSEPAVPDDPYVL